ncbi:Reverse transcriptase domain [Cinara cedri]|uniref:Reverse transcriptase domain n=1 Tax=Cinara cedri TaxID=506608 RepID=A0A5E4NQP9_9HEMI|nr:Reverse transcriptase domain [Cinara cedri]
MVNKEAKRAKEEWFENMCSEVENCLIRVLSDKAYKIIKRFFGIYKSGGKVLRRKDTLEGTGKEALCNITNAYETGELPEDFEKCVMILIPKKQKAKRCEEYRTLSLISHALKILTKIVHKRIEKKIEDILTEDQFGFRKNRGTREAILCLRLIIEKMFRINKPIYIAFVDLKKTFDNVRWEKLFLIMDKIDIDFKDKKLIHKLYINEKAEALKDLKEEDIGGIKIGGMLVQMLRFADDIAMVADSEENLERMLQKMNNTLKQEYNMNINKTKIKILVGSRQQVDTNIIMDGIKLENINSYTYLGSRVMSNGKSATDFRCRIAQAKQAFFKKKKLLTRNVININIRKILMKTLVWSVALYGAESWTILKPDRRKIEVFETWC